MFIWTTVPSGVASVLRAPVQRHVMVPHVTKHLSNSFAAMTGRTIMANCHFTRRWPNSRKSTCVGGLAQELQTITSLQSMKCRKYASDLAYLSYYYLLTQKLCKLLTLFKKYEFSPSGTLNLVGPCALHMLHSPLLCHWQYHHSHLSVFFFCSDVFAVGVNKHKSGRAKVKKSHKIVIFYTFVEKHPLPPWTDLN